MADAPKTGKTRPEWPIAYVAHLNAAAIEADEKLLKGLQGAMRRDFYPSIGLRRADCFYQMRMTYVFAKDGYTAIQIQLHVHKTSTIVGYLLVPPGATPSSTFVITGHTFVSMDGEYRSRLWFLDEFENEYALRAEALEPIELELLALIGSGDALLTESRYTPPGAKAERISAPANLQMRIAAFALSADSARSFPDRARAVAHRVPTFTEVMRAFSARPSGREALQQSSRDLRRRRQRGRHTVRVGVKFIPLTVREAMQPFDVTFAGWRELVALEVASDLVLNGISPAVPQFNAWTFVTNADAKFYENPGVHTKFVHSSTALAAVGKLREGKRLVREAATNQPKFADFADVIQRGVVLAQSQLLQACVALALTMEHVGSTVATHATLMRYAGEQPPITNAFATEASGFHLLFNYVHGAYCLHQKCGIAHTDIHENNLTLNDPLHLYVAREEKNGSKWARITKEHELVAYIVGDAEMTFLFELNGTCGYIIDYSRAIFGAKMQARLAEIHSPQYIETFYKHQSDRILRTIKRYAPQFAAEHSAALEAAVRTEQEVVFSALCAVDFIAIGRSLRALFERETADPGDESAQRRYEVPASVIAAAAELERLARARFIEALTAIVAGSPAPALPGAALLAELFAKYTWPAWVSDSERLAKFEITDVWNSTLDVKFSGSDVRKFPPWIKRPAEAPISVPSTIDRPLQFVALAEQIRAEQDALDGSSAVGESSPSL